MLLECLPRSNVNIEQIRQRDQWDILADVLGGTLLSVLYECHVHELKSAKCPR